MGHVWGEGVKNCVFTEYELGIKGARLEEHIQLSLPKMTFIYGVV
jgi:hypothetical protein